MTTVATEQLAEVVETTPRTRVAAAFVAPRHRHDHHWPWITRIPPMDGLDFYRYFVDNVFEPFPKLTGLYRRWQYAEAARMASTRELAFYFSTDIAVGMTTWPAARYGAQRRIYVGFTQDGPWPRTKIDLLSRTLSGFDAVSVFTDAERSVYLERYGLEPERVRTIPIHTDETNDYRQYPDASPRTEPYVLSLGSPNRRFRPLAEICRDLGVPLVIMTRPTHTGDDLNELSDLGAEVITDADKMQALTALKHARLAAMQFATPDLPGGYTTLVHAMFMRTPFVVNECLGMREHVIDGETGYVAPHGDRDAMRDAIERLWNDPDQCTSFGNNAHQRAVERHSLEAAARNFHQLATDVLAG